MLTQSSREADFPTLSQMTYLNTAAEGIPPRCVQQALTQYFLDHQLGMDGRSFHFAQLDALKALTAEFFGLSAQEIAVCSCSSEAYNLAALALQLKEGDEVVINDLDFPAGITPWLQPTSPAKVKVWRARTGRLHTEDLIPLLSPRTRLVTVSLVSFYNGFKLHLPAVVETIRRHSPALLAADVTQALGRIPLDLRGVDLIVSSTHKWILSSHGGGLVGVPTQSAAAFTVPAGGWFHLKDPFGEERFERAESRPGAAGFAVGMPNFPAIYAVHAGLSYLREIGVPAIAEAADPLIEECIEELVKLPVELLTPVDKDSRAGIVSFRHPEMERIALACKENRVHVMAQAGRIRIAIHGYNSSNDVGQVLRSVYEGLLPKA
ncbi:aminotransferase class V-fold PLP-dependent enzyme [bacterium]|nr:aminotransferase class V-fold PLP-dependent enzyme [bacterium]